MPNVVWLTLLLSTLVTAVGVILLRTQADRLHLVDLPGGHKRHQGAVPVIGGLAMFIGVVVSLSILPGALAATPVLMFGCLAFVLMGAYDDAHHLSPRVRLLAQVVVAALIVYFSPHNVRLETLGNFLGLGEVRLGLMSEPFTVFVIVAAVNAFNMLDGLDGLAGGVSFAAGAALLAVSGSGIPLSLIPVLAALVGATFAFLCFNAPALINRPMRTFMGDAGSTLIGLILATVLVAACQGQARLLSPVNAIWCLFLPATEVIQSTLRRLLAGRSPFAPDRGHLHHQLRAAGLPVQGIFLLVTATSLVGCVVGVLFERTAVPDVVSFAILLAASATYMGVIRVLVLRVHARLVLEEQDSVLADGIGDVPHVSGVEGLDRKHYYTASVRLTTLSNPNAMSRPRFITPEFGPPDVEPASDADVA